MKGGTWTIKDNIVNEYSTFSTFEYALACAFDLYAISDGYYVHTLVYYQDDMDDSDL
jgi:hypothetical protein